KLVEQDAAAAERRISMPRTLASPATAPAFTKRRPRYAGSFQTVAITRSECLITRSRASPRTATTSIPLRSIAGRSHARYAIAAETRIAIHVQALNTLRSIVTICVTSGGYDRRRQL